VTSAYESGVPPHNAVADALRNQQSFSRDQLWWLMRTAWRWGYETAVDEENASWPPPKVFNLGKWYDQAAARQHADAVAQLSRPGDHKGGPVPVWGDEDNQRVAA
jgi:hypothetical protein